MGQDINKGEDRVVGRRSRWACGAALLLAFAAAVTVTADGDARTWHVRKDGTGDFSVIQDAANAVSDGDTILVGAGVYDELAPYQVGPTLNRPVIVGIDKKDIVLAGVDRDSVVLGPAEIPGDVYGIVLNYPNGSRLTVKDLTVRSMSDGVKVAAPVTLDGVRVTACQDGIQVEDFSRTWLTNCVIDSCAGVGIFATSGSEEILVQDTEIRDCAQGIQVFGTPLSVLERLTISGGIVGIAIVEGAKSSIVSCNVTNPEFYSVDLGWAAEADIQDCRFEGGQVNIGLRDARSMTGGGNRLAGSTNAAIFNIRAMETLDFTGNEILRGDGLLVKVRTILDQGAVLDLSGNWWGTTDPDSVRSWIVDAESDTTLGPRVEFQPMLLEQVDAGRSSTGRLKSKY